jgi:signal transduction histidine kinase
MNVAPAAFTERIQPILLDIAELAPLEQVGERLAVAASELTAAPYAAIGVYGEAGQLTRFITYGMDEATVAQMPHPPRGDGLLGEVARQTTPLRVEHVAAHRASSGVPSGHPAMGPYLGVPVMQGTRAIGAFYVTRRPGSEPFTEADEERLLALAPYASVAMSNAMVHELELRRAQCAAEIIQASAQLQTIEDERACASALSRSIERLFPDHQHVVVISPEEGAVIDSTLLEPTQSALAEAFAEVSDSLKAGQHWLDELLPGHSVLAYVAGPQSNLLVAVACDGIQRPDEVDQLALAQLADIGAIALSSVRRQAAARALERYQIRDAIARDLHDDLIQSIYSVGLGLQISRHDESALGVALDRTVDALSEVIRDLRAYIAQLERGVEGLTSTEMLATRLTGQLRSDDRTRWSE